MQKLKPEDLDQIAERINTIAEGETSQPRARITVHLGTCGLSAGANKMFELLLARCPDSEVLQGMAAEYGVSKSRIKLKKQDTCILCGPCVHVCAEVTKRDAISFAERGSKRKVATPFDKKSAPCIGCGACAYLCPTQTIKVEKA